MQASITAYGGGRLVFDDDKYRSKRLKDWNVSVQILDRDGKVIGKTIVKHSDLKVIVKAF